MEKYLKRRLQHAEKRVSEIQERQGPDPIVQVNYYGGKELGYWEGLATAYENALDEVKGDSALRFSNDLGHEVRLAAAEKQDELAQELFRQIMNRFSKSGEEEMLREDFADDNNLEEEYVDVLFGLINEKIKG